MMPINFGNGVTMFMPLESFYDGADGTFPDISIYWLIVWMVIGTILYVVVCYQFLCITHETTSIKEIVRQTNLIADDPIERLIIGMLVFLGFLASIICGPFVLIANIILVLIYAVCCD